MLLDLGRLLQYRDNTKAFTYFTDNLSVSTRETDAKGWYKDGSVFGVIFTEIGDGDAHAITKVLLNKITDGPRNMLRVDD